MSNYLKSFLVGFFVVPAFSFANLDEQNDDGWYVGAGIASSTVSIEIGSDYKIEDSPSSLVIYGGYQFTKEFGLDLNVTTTTYLDSERPGMNDATLSSFSITPVYTYALNHTVSLYGKAGLAGVTYEEEYTLFDDVETWKGNLFTAGFGGIYRPKPSARVTFGVQYYSGTLNHERDAFREYLPNAEVESLMFSFGGHYQF